jgi:hypothetical protein
MAHVPPSPQSPETEGVEALALQACDDVDSLHVVQRPTRASKNSSIRWT